MHGLDDAPASPAASPASSKDSAESNKPWYTLLNSYHWFVLLVASLGWLFDCLDQQLFVLARPKAMAELVVAPKDPPPGYSVDDDRRLKGTYSTSVFMAGWAIGGIVFGMLGDRIGRAKTMLITVLMYSAFTGLSAASRGFLDFAFYRFLTGLGVGGEFAVGVALVAEVMPNRARPYALVTLQALSGVGNVTAALIFWYLGVSESSDAEFKFWRVMFIVGAAPALLAVLIRWGLKEPEQWVAAQNDPAKPKTSLFASYGEMFGHPVWRRHAILGMLLACAGVVGLWSVGFFTSDLIGYVQKKPLRVQTAREFAAKFPERGDSFEKLAQFHEKARTSDKAPPELAPLEKEVDAAIAPKLIPWAAYTSIMLNIGAATGMFGFGFLTYRLGRKPAFAICFVAAFVSTAVVFLTISQLWHIFVLVPIMGFCQLSLFAGYAMYFPELFPTRIRSTGTSFCYNVGRLFAAVGPFVLGYLQTGVYKGAEEPLRYAGATLAGVFLLGLLALPFLPETKDQPLPE